MSAAGSTGEWKELGMQFADDFRDQKLKINDDKKVTINLSKIKRTDIMFFLFVKTFDLSAAPPKEGEFNRAIFRLLDEETNQTVDYREVSKIDLPEGFEEDSAGHEEEASVRKSVTYFAGRIFKPEEHWMYESYGHVFTSEQQADLPASLCQLYKETKTEFE